MASTPCIDWSAFPAEAAPLPDEDDDDEEDDETEVEVDTDVWTSTPDVDAVATRLRFWFAVLSTSLLFVVAEVIDSADAIGNTRASISASTIVNIRIVSVVLREHRDLCYPLSGGDVRI